MGVGFASYGIASAAFAGLTVLMALGCRGRGPGLYGIVAAVLTAVWAGAVAHDLWSGLTLGTLGAVTEVLRDLAWMAFLAAALKPTWETSGSPWPRRLALAAVAALAVLTVAVTLVPGLVVALALPANPAAASVIGRLLLAVIGLATVENFYRNTPADRRWGVKHMAFGLGGLFAYDIFLYADTILIRMFSADLVLAQGFADALVAPLIAVSAARNPQWSLVVNVSRRFAFHSVAIVATGVYMLTMAAVGFYLRQVGALWGPVLQTVFLFGAVVLLIVVVSSGRIRSHLYVVLNKHFFSYRYDYRDEWLRFIRTMSATATGIELGERAIRAVADIVDSPEGALWLADDGGHFVPMAQWNARWRSESVAVDGPFAAFLEDRKWIVDVAAAAAEPKAYADGGLPEWLTPERRAWLVVPLLHEDRLLGFIVLGPPRAPRALNWEDFDLLKTVGHQIAGYLALEHAVRALAEARRFEEFSRRFAFVLHDLKNLVSQLSLMVANAAKHKDNPAFQEDMIRTVQDSVEKMNRLLVRLHADSLREARAVVALGPLLRKAAAVNRRDGVAIVFDDVVAAAVTTGDADRLTAVFDHLIANAVEASPPDSDVRIRLRTERGRAVVEVTDRGPGMDETFVREQLFRPFTSTKEGGYGIGVYESREYLREMGGRLEVVSAPGEGTTMRVILPAVGGEPEADDEAKLSA